MKNLITYLKTLWRRVADSQSNDISLDRRLTVGSPSGFNSKLMLKLVSVLVLVLTIGVGNAWGATVTYSNSDFSGGSSGSNSTLTVTQHSPISVSAVGYKAAAHVRFYSGGEMTISGATITQVVFTCTSDDYATALAGFTFSTGSCSHSSTTATWTGSTTSLKITSNAQTRYSQFVVTYTAQVAEPYTVRFYTASGIYSDIEEASAGAGVTPPVMSTPCDGWAFQGWSKSQSTSSTSTTVLTTETLTAGKYYPSANTTLYPVYTKTGTIENEVSDEITQSTTGLCTGGKGCSSGYTAWSNKNITSDAIYAGSSNASVAYIQLRNSSTAPASGVISTTSGGTLKSVEIEWNSSTTNARYVTIYGKNTAYSATSQLYDNSTAGTSLGTIIKGTSTTLDNLDELATTYSYVGIIASAAIYIDQITITWLYEEDVTYYYSYPTCCTPLGSINGSFTFSNVSPTSVTVGVPSDYSDKNNANLQGYIFKRYAASTGGSALETIETNSSSGTTATFSTGLVANTAYYYTIIAKHSSSSCNSEETSPRKSHTITSYIVSYAAGDGSGDNPGAHNPVLSGTSVTLKANTFDAPAGKQFAGWNDGTNDYEAGDSYSVTANKTMTAQWSCITPHISSQSISNANYLVGATPVTELSVTIDNGSYDYQWQSSSTENGEYSPVAGATSSSFTPPVSATSDLWYKCVITNTGSSCNTTATSNKAHIVVAAPSYRLWTGWGNGGDLSQPANTWDWVGGAYFVQVNSSNEWRITNYTIPNHVWTGSAQMVYNVEGKNTTNTKFYDLAFAVSQGTASVKKGPMPGAVGTLRMYDNSDQPNGYLGFIPNNYMVRFGTHDYIMTETSSTVWETAIQTLDAADLTNVSQYRVGVTNSSDEFVAINENCPLTNVTSMGQKSNAGNSWGSNLASGDAGKRGKFRIWLDNATNNWTCHFVPYHRIIFDANWPSGGIGDEPADTYSVDVSVEETNSSIALASAPTAPAGYTFDGWYTAADGGTKRTGNQTISAGATADVTLYAHWTANNNTAYTVKHYQQNIANDDYTEVTGDRQNLTGTTGASVTPAVNSYTGFTAPSTQTAAILGDGSLVIEYQYSRNSYTLTWALNGGTVTTAGTCAAVDATGSPSGSVKYGASLTAPVVAKSGYNMTWSSSPAATMPAGNTTYTANWAVINYTITYHLNDGTQQVSPAPATNYNVESAAITLPTPTREGYNFDGWYANSDLSTGGVQTTIAAGSTGNKEYWAKWTIKNFTVSWKWKGDADYTAGVTDANNNADYNTTVSAPTAPADDALSCANKFMGWTATPLGSATGQSAPGDLFTTTSPAITANTTFYAVFATGSSGGGTSANSISSYEDGTYYMIDSHTYDDVTTYYSPSGTASGQIGSVELTSIVSVSNGVLTLDLTSDLLTEAMKYTITTVAGEPNTYTIYNASTEQYIGASTSTSFTVSNTNKWELMTSDKRFMFWYDQSTDRAVLYQHSYNGTGNVKTYGKRFGCYSKANAGRTDLNSNKEQYGSGYLFLVPAASTTYSDYVTSCCSLKPVTNLTVSSVTANSVTLSWTAPSPTTGIDYLEVYKDGVKVGSNITNLATTSTTVSGLTECTTYAFQIISVGATCNTPSETVNATPFSGSKTVNYIYHDGATADSQFTTDCAHPTITLPTPVWALHTFQGWFTAATDGTRVGGGGDTYNPLSSPVTVHAQWTETEYVLTQTTGSHTTKGHAGTSIKTSDIASSPLELTYSISDGSYALPKTVNISGGGIATWTLGTHYTWALSADKHSATLTIASGLTISADVTITVTEQARYTVIWDRPGSSNDETEYYAADDNSVTMKTGELPCGTKAFYCWTEDDEFVSHATTPPTAASSGSISGNKHYYAIYADATEPLNPGYNKITSSSNIVDGGTYLIVAPAVDYNSNGWHYEQYAYTGDNGNSKGGCVSVTFADQAETSITSKPNTAQEVVLDLVSGQTNQFTLNYGDSHYLKGSTSSNELTHSALNDQDGLYYWKISTTDGHVGCIAPISGSRFLQSNANNSQTGVFACYGGAQADAYLYLKETTAYSNFAKTCTLYDIEITTPSGGTVTTTPTAGTGVAGEGQTITVNVTPNSCKYLSALKYNDGSDHDILSTRSFTMPAADVTVTATFSDKTVSSITPITDSHRTLMQNTSFVGEDIRVTYNNGETEDLTFGDSKLAYTGYNMSSLTNQTVTVTYTGCGSTTTTYSITITDGIPVTFSDCGNTTLRKYDPGDVVPVETTSGAYACSGWEFVGWSETSVAANSTSFTPVRNFTASTARTLYAVYAHIRKDGSNNDQYESADMIANLQEGARYVVAYFSNSNDGISAGLTGLLPTVASTDYLAGTSSFAGTEDRNASNSNVYHSTASIAANAHWQLMADGVGYWQLYNKSADKYLDLSGHSSGYIAVSSSKVGKLVIGNYTDIVGSNDSRLEIKYKDCSDPHYVSWYRQGSYFNQYSSGKVFLLTKDEYFSSTPPCAPRSVTFHGNGGTVIASGGSPEGADLVITEDSRDEGINLPTAETDASDCDGKEWSFVGWIDHEVDVTRVPILTTDMVNDGYDALDPNPHYTIVTDNDEFWAVYTNTGEPETKYGAISFAMADFNLSYSSSENTTTKTVAGIGDYIFGYVNIGHASSTGIQFQENTGSLYNKTSLGKVNSISFTTFNAGSIDKLNVYVGNEERTTDHLLTAAEMQNVGSTWTYYPKANESYVYITNIGKGNGSYVCVSGISIDFGKGTQVWATTPDCSTISLSGDVRVTSTGGKGIRAITPITISGHGLAANAAVTLAAYNVSDDTPNSHFGFGSTINADVNGDISSTDVVVVYTPTETTDGIEEVYFKASATAANGSSTTESRKLNGYGRHLPTKFIIAQKVGDDWFALPNGMNNNYTSWTNGVKLSSVDEGTGVATFYSDTTDQFAYQLLISRGLEIKGLVFSSPRKSNNIIKANTAKPNTTFGLYAQSGWTSAALANVGYYEFLPTTSDLLNYTLLNTFQTNYLGITTGKWGIGSASTVRFFSIDQQPAPTITWRNNMLSEDHATNKAENGVVTLPTGADPVSCNTTLFPTFCGWSATEPTGSYWSAEPSYITAGTVATENTTYYAVFKDATRNRWYTQCPTYYTLTFQAGTGTGSDYVTYTENTTYAMPDAATTGMSKEGYTLSGWTTTTAVTVGGSSVAAGGVIPVGATISGISGDMTFTAVWTGNISITGDVWLTSYNGVTVYATSTTNNLITVSSADATGATRFKIIYLDGNGDEVAKGSSRFRLCNNGSSNYNMVDVSSEYVSVSAGVYSQTYSISYTPNAHNTINTGTLKLQLMHNTTVLSEATLVLHGRALPEEFVIATKGNDNIWYALPNTIVDNTHAVAPIRITVNNATTPTAATYAPNTTVFKGDGRYNNAANRYAVRFTDGVLNNEDKLNHLQISSSTDTHYPWLSYSGSSTNQDWWLSSSNFGAYTLKVPTSGATSEYMLGIYDGNIGFFSSVTSGPIFLLPITHKITDNPASVTEWGQKSVILDVDAQTASSAQARLGSGEPEEAASFGQTLTSVKGNATKYNYTLSFSTLDFSAHKGELLYIDWLDAEDNVLSTSAITIPWIIASDGVMGSIDNVQAHWKDWEVHVLPGITLEADGSSFSSSTAKVRSLEIYPGAIVKVTSGTLDVVMDLVLRYGWTRASEKSYNVAQLQIKRGEGGANVTTNHVYADWYIDYDQYYPISVPWNVTVANITYKNSNSAASAGMKLRYYDGASRATNGQTGVDDGVNWKEYSPLPETLVPSMGYALTAKRPSGKAFSILRMPLTIPSASWTALGEQGEVSSAHKNQVSVTGYGMGSSEWYAMGWNFIGNPYMSTFNGDDEGISGKLELQNGGSIRYATIPDLEFRNYYQVNIAEANLKPASGFFVQANNAEAQTITFAASKIVAPSAPARYTEKNETVPEQEAYIRLSNDDDIKDQMGLIIGDNYTAEYEPNADLVKVLGEANALKTYMRYINMDMAYVAINETLAKEWIPVTVRIPSSGDYTFSLTNSSVVEHLEGVYLIDYKYGMVTNLIGDTYSFRIDEGVTTDRFAINAIVDKRETPTDVGNVDGMDSEHPLKFLYRDKLYILRNGVLYDATGKKVQ